jgi:hypothetical protein
MFIARLGPLAHNRKPTLTPGVCEKATRRLQILKGVNVMHKVLTIRW